MLVSLYIYISFNDLQQIHRILVLFQLVFLKPDHALKTHETGLQVSEIALVL